MTASGRTPRRSSSGSTSQALPSRPTESGLPAGARASSSSSASSSVPACTSRYLVCQALGDALRAALDGEHRGPRHGGGERLRAAHAAEARGEDPPAGEVAAVVLAAHFDERLVGALHDSLAADVDPRARRHLAEHHEALAIELVEVLPVRPARHEVRVGEQHARGIRVGAEHSDGLAGLDEERLVLLQRAQRADDLLVALPVARRLADAAVNHQLLGPLGDFRIEVVHQHAQRRFGQPAAAAECRAPRGAQRHSGGWGSHVDLG